ncbi:hypothetical protein Anas_02606 [Armadillidium nasatum]|uniref:Uncharacterized protein n=1 Tax=Armadillidium nasatum TaxID=96803 RepID=A0A5N5TMZ1_9CRUS|nr:hypothetical protein Anas_02606 [Armadillidium nasatum]
MDIILTITFLTKTLKLSCGSSFDIQLKNHLKYFIFSTASRILKNGPSSYLPELEQCMLKLQKYKIKVSSYLDFHKWSLHLTFAVLYIYISRFLMLLIFKNANKILEFVDGKDYYEKEIMNDEIEILESSTVNSMLANILTSTKEINQLNIEGDGGGVDDEDDDDIICLDTVFKPKKIDDVDRNNFKTFKSPNANLDTRMPSTNFGHNSSTCFVSDLEKDEIPIDELISHPSNLNQSFNKEVSQKRLQDGNTRVGKPGKKLKGNSPNISTKISKDKTKVPMQHPIPPGSVLNTTFRRSRAMQRSEESFPSIKNSSWRLDLKLQQV